MSVLRIYTDQDVTNLLFTTTSKERIAQKLADVGVRYEQWQTDADLEPGTPPDEVITAYSADIDRLMENDGYQAVDVISLNAQHPKTAEMRQKFLSEHTHSEDEVRFFVAGEGLFTLHIADKVYEIHCTQGDLINVPANTTHWFDMGPNPGFIAIRLFNNPEGWVANFTGSDIAQRFNRLEN